MICSSCDQRVSTREVPRSLPGGRRNQLPHIPPTPSRALSRRTTEVWAWYLQPSQVCLGWIFAQSLASSLSPIPLSSRPLWHLHISLSLCLILPIPPFSLSPSSLSLPSLPLLSLSPLSLSLAPSLPHSLSVSPSLSLSPNCTFQITKFHLNSIESTKKPIQENIGFFIIYCILWLVGRLSVCLWVRPSATVYLANGFQGGYMFVYVHMYMCVFACQSVCLPLAPSVSLTVYSVPS